MSQNFTALSFRKANTLEFWARSISRSKTSVQHAAKGTRKNLLNLRPLIIPFKTRQHSYSLRYVLSQRRRRGEPRTTGLEDVRWTTAVLMNTALGFCCNFFFSYSQSFPFHIFLSPRSTSLSFLPSTHLSLIYLPFRPSIYSSLSHMFVFYT